MMLALSMSKQICMVSEDAGPASSLATIAAPLSVKSAQRPALLIFASSVVVAFLAAANAASPLYQRYEKTWHASSLTGTLAFAAYAVTVVTGLLWLSRLSEVFGRRHVLFVSISVQVVALLLFTVAGSFTVVIAARLLQGLASGAALGILSATMIDAHLERGTIASAASPGTGSGLGALFSGLTVQFLPGPTHTIYLILAAVLTTQALLALHLIPAGGGQRSAARRALRPSVAIPAHGRLMFLTVAPVVFAAWSLSGFYAALSPALYTTLSGSSTVWPTALPLFVLMATGTLTTVVLRNTTGHALTVISAVNTLAGLGATVIAVELENVGLFLVGSAIAGFGFGTGFQGAVSSLTPLATPEERPALMSAVFIVAYSGLGIAAIIPGALIGAGASLPTVTVELAAALAVITALSLCATLTTRAS